jgi:ABC-type antimicrobial peptide transport system permease subunit
MLTSLGIVIGIAAVVAMVEIGNGASLAIHRAIAALGAAVIQIDPSDSPVAGVSTGSGSRVTLTPDDCQALATECDAVLRSAPSVDCHAQVAYQNRNWAPRNILGTTPAYLAIREWSELTEGEPFTEDDVRREATVCMIGQTPARELFGDESPIGKEVRVRSVRLKVVGVLAKKGASVTGMDLDDFFVAPWTTVKYRLSGQRQPGEGVPVAEAVASGVNTINNLYPSVRPQLYPQQSSSQLADSPYVVRFPDLDDVWVAAVSARDVQLAMEQIRQVLRERHGLHEGDADDFRIRDLTEISEAAASSSRLISELLLVVATISLAVGGVGIMNIMLVSVTERTREIGLRMAVGAKAADVLRQFLIESIMLCLLGGGAGVALGRLASAGVGKLMGWSTLPSPGAAVMAVAVSAGIGVVFGYYPAWRASRLDPIEALRFE